MGAANKVPGVSGGTVSFVLGFYEELIFLSANQFKSMYITVKAFEVFSLHQCAFFSVGSRRKYF